MNRSQSRVIKLSKEKIERDIEKLKRRMNRLYQEILAREQALKLFEVPAKAEQDKEAELRNECTEELAQLEKEVAAIKKEEEGQ